MIGMNIKLAIFTQKIHPPTLRLLEMEDIAKVINSDKTRNYIDFKIETLAHGDGVYIIIIAKYFDVVETVINDKEKPELEINTTDDAIAKKLDELYNKISQDK